MLGRRVLDHLGRRSKCRCRSQDDDATSGGSPTGRVAQHRHRILRLHERRHGPCDEKGAFDVDLEHGLELHGAGIGDLVGQLHANLDTKFERVRICMSATGIAADKAEKKTIFERDGARNQSAPYPRAVDAIVNSTQHTPCERYGQLDGTLVCNVDPRGFCTP